MASKAIKLTNGSITYLPVTTADLVQYKYGTGSYTSVQQAIGITAGSVAQHIGNGTYIAYSTSNGLYTTGEHGSTSGVKINGGSETGKATIYVGHNNDNNTLTITTNATTNTGTVTSVTAGDGLVTASGNAITGSDTIKAKLKDYTKNSSDATTADTTGGSLEPVQLDKSGNLAVYVKDTTANYYDTITKSYTGQTGLKLFSVTPHSTGSTTGDYYVGVATASSFGVVKSSTTGTETGRDYNVQVNTDGTMKVNVPWKDYDNIITGVMHMKGGTTSGPASNVAYTNGDTYIYNGTSTYTIPAALSYNGAAQIVTKGDMFTYADGKWTVLENNNEVATSSTLGLVKSSTTGTTSGRDYNVQVNSDGTMKANVPWTDHTSSLTASGTKNSNNVVSDVVLTKSTSGNNTAYTLTVSYTSITSNVTSRLVGENISAGGAYIHNYEPSSSNSKIWIKPGNQISISYTGTSPNQNILISSTVSYTGSKGITVTSSNDIQHTNSITAVTTPALKKFKYDAQGHITGIENVSTSSVTLDSLKYKVGNTVDDIDDTALGLTFGSDINIASLGGTTTFVTA